MFKVGDQVICSVYGSGKIDKISSDKMMSVKFERAGLWYTLDGKLYWSQEKGVTLRKLTKLELSLR